MMRKVLVCAILACTATAAQADMKVQLMAPWDGKTVPPGQHCTLHGGNGSTPPMQITGLPAGTALVVVEYNDKSYKPLSRNGGHGTLGYPIKGSSATLAPVPGLTAKLPGGVRVIRRAKSTGAYASAGYLPPCSGGRGNRYTADVLAVGADGKVIEKTTVTLGRY